MKFGWGLLLGALIAASGWGYAAPVRAQSDSQASPEIKVQLAPQYRMQRGRQAARLQTLDGFKLTRWAQRMGDISAIAAGEDGRIYVADKSTGRVFVLHDRDRDGKVERTQPLAQRFDGPTGLVEIGGMLYVADRGAVWRVPPSGTPTKLAGLAFVKTDGVHPMHKGLDDQSLILGLSTVQNEVQVLSLKLTTGEAVLFERAPGSNLRFGPMDAGRPWVAFSRGGKAHIGGSLRAALSVEGVRQVEEIALLTPARVPDLPSAMDGHSVVASDGYSLSVKTFPSVLGQVVPKPKALLGGFAAQRTAWGAPGAILIDPRGIFIADRFNGDIYRLDAISPTGPIVKDATEPASETTPEIEPESLKVRGTLPIKSSIDKASRIDKASTMTSRLTQEEDKPEIDAPENTDDE